MSTTLLASRTSRPERTPAERQSHVQMDAQRIARRVGDAEVRARHQEETIVFEHHGAGQGDGVDAEGPIHCHGKSRRVKSASVTPPLDSPPARFRSVVLPSGA